MKEQRYNNDAEAAKLKGELDNAMNNAGIAAQMSTQAKNLDNGLKNYLNDEYQRQIDDNKRKALEAKQRDLMEDQNMLDKDRLRNRNSKRAQKDKNNAYKADLDNVADYHNYLKNQLAKDEAQKEDEKYRLGCQLENEKRDKEKEDWFRKFKKINDDMDKNLKATLDKARPDMDRQNAIDKKIKDDFDKYGNKMFDDKEKERELMKAQWQNTLNENRRNLNDKSKASQMAKEKDKEELENKLREAMAYNQGEQDNQRKLEEQRHLYKEVLQNQMSLNALGKYNYGNMTHEEKNINKADLKGYKEGDMRTQHAMIPGIKNVNSVGSKPLMRGAMNVMDFSDSPPQGPKGRKGQIFYSPDPRTQQSHVENFGGTSGYQHPLPHQTGIVQSNILGGIKKPGTPTSYGAGQSMNRTDFERYKQTSSMSTLPRGAHTSRNTPSMMSTHNPITQPVDTTTHNPNVFNQIPAQYRSVQY